MKAKSPFFILATFILFISLNVQGVILTSPLEDQAFDADYVVIAKYIYSIEVQASKTQTYKIDRFLLEKILVQNVDGKFMSVNYHDDIFKKEDMKPNTDKIFCVMRLADRGMGLSPSIKDPQFKKDSSYLLVVKSLYPNNSYAGMYTPISAYQKFPLATEEIISKFMKEYKRLKQERAKSITIPGVTAKGAILTKRQGNSFYYRKKCEHCGYVSPKQRGTELRPVFKMNIEFVCPKCDKATKGSIER